MQPLGRKDFIEDDEYSDDKDLDEFGYESPHDDDYLTIGYLGDNRPRFWTPKRIGILIIVLILIIALLPTLWLANPN